MKISVFTPTYNRKKLLEDAYKSLCAQDYKSIEWVVMDDGSIDGTREKVLEWKNENKIKIKYAYQDNHGRFYAFNHAKRYITGELLLFLDSDNVLLPGAIKRISSIWRRLGEKTKNISGMIAYMEADGEIVGNKFPDHVKIARIYTLYDKYKLFGDKALVFRNDILQKYEYPVFEGEKFGGDAILFNRINEDAPMYIWRKPIIKRRNPKDSITNNVKKHHLASPNGMREHYRDCLLHESYDNWKIMKHCAGYIAYSLMIGADIYEIIMGSSKKIRTCCAFPAGVMCFFKNKYDERKLMK